MGVWQWLMELGTGPATDPGACEPVTLARALSEIADAARLDRSPAPVITTDLSSAMILARLLDRDMPGLQHATNIATQQDLMTVIMFDGVKIKWSSNRET